MKRTFASTTLVMAFATVFVLGILPSLRTTAQADERRGRECSNASLQGSFGFTSTGTLLALPAPLAGPMGEIGRESFDGEGNTDATATLVTNGGLHKVTWVGTYGVNPDCTGSMTLLISPLNATVTLDFVIDDDGAEVRAILTGNVTGNTETRVYRKQFRGHGQGED